MTDSTVDFELTDYGGHGGEPESSSHGVGLIGLGERVALLDGDFSAGAAPGGWLVSARLPSRSRVAA
ncbi:hypothetical protein LTV02_31860 [Nocardia yamanashiensis]|uniref:hypothetical protein n=1 Tax=Nocardia yamanashiensis TaxID=209247 RepID=UPI001E35F6D2|nr:hypothetical protein [Nocardia yamanashiensis]UGT40555.1 hypothetical protein LTV02_31860 [Nocardia yamanashiensis]